MKEDNPLSQPEKGFTRRALNKGGYDPRSVLRWGQMMAISLLEVVKAVERRFGEEDVWGAGSKALAKREIQERKQT